MYASTVTPVQRMRGSSSQSSISTSISSSSGVGRRHSSNSATISTTCMSPTKASSTNASSLSAFDSVSGSFKSRRSSRNQVVGPPNVNRDGDYQLLRSKVEVERTRVHEARVDLATKLDELGDHHVRRKEYDNAMDAFTEALREKRSVFWNIGNYNVRNNPPKKDHKKMSSSPRKSKSNQNYDPNSDHASSFSSSLLSGISAGNSSGLATTKTTTTNDKNNSSSNEEDNESYREHVRVHDATIDALVHTLRNIGNVHSLRGEQDEAMRYFTEVTTLRAQKLSCEYETNCQDADDASVETRSFLSGLGGGNSAFSANTAKTVTTDPGSGMTATTVATTPHTHTTAAATSTGGDENSALMSEINEDVRALDDLFRSISFRQQGGTATNGGTGIAGSPKSEKRKSKSSSRKSKKHKRGSGGSNSNTGSHRRSLSSPTSSAGAAHVTVDASDEPFHRDSAAAPNTPSSACVSGSIHPASPATTNRTTTATSAGGEDMFLSAFTLGPPGSSATTLAMEKYHSALEYLHDDHPRLRHHHEKMNFFALRIDLQTTTTTSGGATATKTNNSSESTMDATETKADLELSLDIYRHVLQAYRELSVSPGSNRDLHIQTTVPLSSSSCSSTQQQQPILSICSTESSSSLSLSSSSSSTFSSRKKSKLERRQEIAAHIASVLICTGSVYYRLGQRSEELEAYKRAKNVYCKAFGENHVFVAGTRKNIGMVLAERGQYDLAQRQFEKAMSIYVRQNKEQQQRHESKMAAAAATSTMSTDDSYNDNGGASSIYPSKNELQNANMNRDVASVISCIGNVKNRVGELDAALTKYLQALQIYKTLYELKKTHAHANTNTKDGKGGSISNPDIESLRDVTSTLKVIGMVHAKRGDLETAMRFFLEAMELLRHHEVAIAAYKTDSSTIVPDDASTETSATEAAGRSVIRETKASVLTRIASIHLKKGELDEAMASYREAYDLTVQNRGNTTNHPEIAGILHYIGGIFHKRGEYDEAMACYQESIRIYHTTLGSDHPTVAGTLVMVGSIHYKRRHLDSAMMFYREALRLNRDAYGMHHPDVAPILKSIGTILTKKGDYQKAYDLFRDVLSVKVTVHGTDHPEVASAYKSLGNVHYKLGELGDAERQYRHALSIYRRCKGDDHSDTISAKTTIEHLRYWMRERDQQQQRQRHSHSEHQQQRRQQSGSSRIDDSHSEERSC